MLLALPTPRRSLSNLVCIRATTHTTLVQVAVCFQLRLQVGPVGTLLYSLGSQPSTDVAKKVTPNVTPLLYA